jgi:hypothetical protein
VVIYFVHEPPNASANRLESAEQLLFVKDGFSWFAALIPAVWMLTKRMWFEAILFMAFAGLLVWAFTAVGAPNMGNAILLAAQILFGFEANALYSAALERRGWRLVGTVSGYNREDSERRFLEVWLPTRTEIPAPVAAAAARPAASWARMAIAQAKNAIARGRGTPAGA